MRPAFFMLFQLCRIIKVRLDLFSPLNSKNLCFCTEPDRS